MLMVILSREDKSQREHTQLHEVMCFFCRNRSIREIFGNNWNLRRIERKREKSQKNSVMLLKTKREIDS